MSSSIILSPQTVSTDVLLEKYCKEGETTVEDIFRRVARGVANAEENQKYWEDKFFDNMMNGAIGAGRIMSAAGTDLKATLINCFVQPVGDCINGYDDDGIPGIYEALRQSACSMQKGGGVGYNFSRLRPKGSWVKSVQSVASGPCSYMDIFDASCKTIESAGCFTGDTLIDTTEGLLKIKDIVESDKEYYAVTHKGPRKITAKFNNGLKPVWIVVSESGHEVHVTKDHKFAQYHIGSIVTRRIEDIESSNNHQLITTTLTGDNTLSLTSTTIRSITKNDELVETYDLEVEDVHLLSGNGFYTSNSRRGAQLAALSIYHPDILDFVKAKRTPGRWNNFNISVLVNDAFMIAKREDHEIELVHKARPSVKQIEDGAYQRDDGVWVYKKIKAHELWNVIMRSNYDFAEPGILFEDRINKDNNLRYIEYIDTTNP
jgi:ribonucleotide reductase alpha subunit